MRAINKADNEFAYGLTFRAKDILDLQNDLALKATQRLHCDGLEQKWRSLTSVQRREFCLEGLFMASTVYGRDMDKRRCWCPDLTLDSLSSEPDTFLSLLSRHVPDNLECKIAEPIVIENVALNHFLQHAPKVLLIGYQYDRAFYMSMALWRILLAVYGETEDGVVIRNPMGDRSRDIPSDLKKVI